MLSVIWSLRFSSGGACSHLKFALEVQRRDAHRDLELH